MQKLKRNNWSNDEIVHLVNQMKTAASEAAKFYYQSVESYNEALNDVITLFLEFEQPVTEWGALAYGLEDKSVVHTGGVPEEHEEKFILERIDNTANILKEKQ
jgi:hypothetical protein